MSETLIALVVIGIVAAITVPTIVARQREQATVEKVKKFYSTMSNALKRAIADTGLQIDEWTYGGGDGYTRESSVNFMKYIKPYLILAADDCGTTGLCSSDEETYSLNGANYGKYYKRQEYYKSILNDGSVFWLRTVKENCQDTCAIVWYDVNGPKRPNVFGKDTFMFAVKKNRIASYGSTCSYSGTGQGCAAYILQNGNMDYLH